MHFTEIFDSHDRTVASIVARLKTSAGFEILFQGVRQI